MGSSAKTGKFLCEGHRSTFFIKVPFKIGHPHLHIKCSLYVCSRGQGSQIFKCNSIILIPSKVIAYLVILLSTCDPRGHHIVPMSSLSSPYHPHHPHVVPIVPTRSPCGSYTAHGCGLHCLHPMWSTHCPHCPHVVPVIPTSSPCHQEGPYIISNPSDSC